ncbi:MAG: cache domain-containing protein, partial [Candidatus Nitrosocaldaceae archaeon]
MGVFSLSINSKIIAFSLLLSIGTLIIVTALSFSTADTLLRERAKDQLISEASGRGAAIRALIKLKIEQIRLLAEDKIIIEDLSEDKKIDRNAIFNLEVEPFMRILGRTLNITNIKIINSDGLILLSSDPSEEGLVYENVNNIEFVFSKVNNERMSIVKVPIIADGKRIGGVIAILGVNDFDEILLNRKGLGNTGEVYLV